MNIELRWLEVLGGFPPEGAMPIHTQNRLNDWRVLQFRLKDPVEGWNHWKAVPVVVQSKEV